MGYETHIEGVIDIHPMIRPQDLYDGDGGFEHILTRLNGKRIDALTGPDDSYKFGGTDAVALVRFVAFHAVAAEHRARFSGHIDFIGEHENGTDRRRFTAAGRRLYVAWWCPEHEMWPDPFLFGHRIKFGNGTGDYNAVNRTGRPEGCSCRERAVLPPF